MNSTIEIPGYAYKVTLFAHWIEASKAREIAMLEGENIIKGNVSIYAYKSKYNHDCGYIVELINTKGYSYFL